MFAKSLSIALACTLLLSSAPVLAQNSSDTPPDTQNADAPTQTPEASSEASEPTESESSESDNTQTPDAEVDSTPDLDPEDLESRPVATPGANAPAETNETSEENPIKSNRFKVVEVEIEGTKFKDAVSLAMYIRPNDEVTTEQVRNDLRRIYGLGYFLDVTARREPVPGGYRLVVLVKENPRLKEVRIVNDLQVYNKEDILKLFADQINQVANFNDIRDVEQRILQMYQEQGYVLANVRFMRTKVNEVDGLISSDGVLELRLNEGIVEDVKVSGNVETKDYVILREVTIEPGELFNSQRFTQDLRRIYNTNFFESVNFKPRKGEEDPNHFIIVLEVSEKPTGQVNMGAGFNNRDGLVGTFQIVKDNLMGEGRRLAVDLQLGVDVLSIFNRSQNFTQAQRTLLGRIDFYDPWMFEGRTSFGSSIFSERIPLFFGSGINASNIFNLPAGTSGIIQSRVGTSVSFGRPLFGGLTSPWRGSLSVRAEQVGVSDLSRNPLRDLSVSNRFSATDVFFSVGGSLSYDTRDIIIDPKSGWYGLFAFEPVWGDSAYLKLSGNLSTYVGLTDWLTLALGARGGTFLGQNPPYEQYYSNGFNVIRGYPENGFLFGRTFIIGSAELRFPIFNPVSGVVFTDIGEFLPVPDSRLELNQGLPFKYGVGLGLRLNTPMGPLRLDYGVRDFSKLNFNSLFDAGQLHFSIGQKF